jgi:hypothetical protein
MMGANCAWRKALHAIAHNVVHPGLPEVFVSRFFHSRLCNDGRLCCCVVSGCSRSNPG